MTTSGTSPQLRDVVVAQRAEAGDIVVRDLVAALTKRCQRLFHVPRIPQHHGVDDETEGVEAQQGRIPAVGATTKALPRATPPRNP